MGSPLLILCLHSTGPVKARVTRTPRHLIKAKGQLVSLRCSPISEQALQVLLEFYEGMQRAKRNFSDRFSGQQFSDYDSELHMSSWGSLYSAVPLCTSCLRLCPHLSTPGCPLYSICSYFCLHHTRLSSRHSPQVSPSSPAEGCSSCVDTGFSFVSPLPPLSRWRALHQASTAHGMTGSVSVPQVLKASSTQQSLYTTPFTGKPLTL
uniref:Uncharacterized protein n=1 Tax=Neovison vison TaxID=452646 RepID=A0A8C7BSK7_NEOVI